METIKLNTKYDISNVPHRAFSSSSLEDVASIAAAFNRTFRSEKTTRDWLWKYPLPGALSRILKSERNVIEGHYGLLPITLSVHGRQVNAAQLVDLFTVEDSKVRGFVKMVSDDMDGLCAKEKIQIVITFPNDNSFVGLMRCGFSRVHCLDQYFRRLGLKREFTRWMRLPLLPRIFSSFYGLGLKFYLKGAQFLISHKLDFAPGFEVSSVLPSKYEEFWSLIKNQEVVCIWKDAAYMQRRYEKHPESKYTFFSIRNKSELVATAVLCSGKEDSFIAEILVKNKAPLLGKLLLNQIEQHCISRGAERLYFNGADVGFFNAIFKDYTHIGGASVPYLAKVIDKTGNLDLILTPKENWTIAWGDGDSI